MAGNLKDHARIYNFFLDLDRSLFLENEYKELAGYDNPLPIGYGQTISQPTLVYQMTVLLDLNEDNRVLEIGTGSGYQTVFLAEFAAQVYTIERIAALALKAQERLSKLGYQNVHFKVGDGSRGWIDFAPYDRIIVTAGAGKLPESLTAQLKPGGRMVVPVGAKGSQDLLLIRKDETGKITQESIGKVIFVELKGEFGWEVTPDD